jgi:hypothetical protein
MQNGQASMEGEAGYYMPTCSIQLYSGLWVIKVMASVIAMVWYPLVLVWSGSPRSGTV